MVAPKAIILDEAQELALSRFSSGTKVAVFGRAGFGKSEVVRRSVTAGIVRWGQNSVAVAALAAAVVLTIGGQSLHSLFGMDTRPLSREA